MLFYLQMKWNIEGRLSFDEVWDLEVRESVSAHGAFTVVGIYKVAGQKRVIAIIEMDSADELDRVIMGGLPLREYLEFEAIWPLRTFDGFIEDCKTHFGAIAPG
jgi:muconolactone D-isomerase